MIVDQWQTTIRRQFVDTFYAFTGWRKLLRWLSSTSARLEDYLFGRLDLEQFIFKLLVDAQACIYLQSFISVTVTEKRSIKHLSSFVCTWRFFYSVYSRYDITKLNSALFDKIMYSCRKTAANIFCDRLTQITQVPAISW